MQAFLTHLAVQEKVSASTQNQAFNAILFLYRKVLGISLEDKNISAIRAARKKNIPVVLTREEVSRLLTLMSGMVQLMARLLYGSGLRVMECVRLRHPHRAGTAGPQRRINHNDLYPCLTAEGNQAGEKPA